MAKFLFNDQTYRVEYEGLNQICFHCSRFGHKVESCPLLANLVVVGDASQGDEPRQKNQ